MQILFVLFCMANFESIIPASNYVLLNPGLERAPPQWSGSIDKIDYAYFSCGKKINATLAKLQDGGSCSGPLSSTD